MNIVQPGSATVNVNAGAVDPRGAPLTRHRVSTVTGTSTTPLPGAATASPARPAPSMRTGVGASASA